MQEIKQPSLVCGELDGNERQTLKRNSKLAIVLSPARSVRRPSFLAELAWGRFIAKHFDDPVTLAPIYLHYSEAIPV